MGQGESILGRFQYDFDGRRTKKIGEDGIRQYVYDQTSLLLEYDENGLPKAKYDYGSDRLISLTRADEGRRFFSFDGLRSVTNLTDDAGSAVASLPPRRLGQLPLPERAAGLQEPLRLHRLHLGQGNEPLLRQGPLLRPGGRDASPARTRSWAKSTTRRACTGTSTRTRTRCGTSIRRDTRADLKNEYRIHEEEKRAKETRDFVQSLNEAAAQTKPKVQQEQATSISRPESSTRGERAQQATQREAEEKQQPVKDAAHAMVIKIGQDASYEGRLRGEVYEKGIAAIRDAVKQRVASGMDPKQAIDWGVAAREDLQNAVRDRSTPLFRAIADRLKPRGQLNADDLIAKKGIDQTIEGMGRPRPGVHKWMLRTRIAGNALLIVGAAVSAKEIHDAPPEEKWRAVGGESAKTLGALGGGAAGARAGAWGGHLPRRAPVGDRHRCRSRWSWWSGVFESLL